MIVGAALAAFILSFLLVRLVLATLAHVAVDTPNARSLHDRPIPRTGGIAVLAAAAISLLFGSTSLWLPMILALVLAVVSFVDDRSDVPSPVRLLAHFGAAGFLVWHTLTPMNLVEQLVLVLAVTWLTNLYNFMDGSDGLAGGMTAIGFGAYSLAAWLADQTAMAVLCAAIAAAAAAFLIHNFHPARIFLGDVGSIPLGFLAAGLGIVGWRDDAWPLWFPVLVFGPFIADATMTLIRRLIRGERVWLAHREHYYQRMVRMGLGHRRTAVVGYGIIVLCAGAALLGRAQTPALQAMAFGLASAVLAMVAVWVDVRWARYARQVSA